MSERNPLVAGNWKMNGDATSLDLLLDTVELPTAVENGPKTTAKKTKSQCGVKNCGSNGCIFTTTI